MEPSSNRIPAKVPRVAITYCTQCRWMLRAAYFGQELLSTFNTSLGEIALIPATGGIFTVHLTYLPSSALVSASATNASDIADAGGAATASAAPPPPPPQETKEVLLWDRKVDGGFPETKELKRRVRDVIEPGRDLGHVDRDHSTSTSTRTGGPRQAEQPDEAVVSGSSKMGEACQDCGP